MWDISWITLILLILASYRLTRLIVFDEILSFVRRPFVEERFETDESGMMYAVVDEKGGRFHTFMRKLLTCYWCVGIWSAAFLVAAYLLIPNLMFPLVLLLAIAGAAGIIESYVKG
ncbi:DUF1360 domain-containing protein [Paenibacillus dendritiformis]|uniref:DUF1360 domain-containing protein n=1 Tax=Paenibacillus dendritiformis C454 TaxID=1131935 RepID=H3SAX3_9BACL|nr:DUF1360 domain-containing protein [Paenibacillus dendritiformis]EHQ63706.1 hypothetical protein PDENDC454_03290 [Paenibacillus dendritiformis C454]CAH8772530.1 DUF1360 domain-containing protein [Paenibacillus dendritiformis]